MVNKNKILTTFKKYLFVLIVPFVHGCKKHNVGDLYSVKIKENIYGIIKILDVRKDELSVRIYSNQYKYRLNDVATDTLNLNAIYNNDGSVKSYALLHQPVYFYQFEEFNPKFIKNEQLKEDEKTHLKTYLNYLKEH